MMPPRLMMRSLRQSAVFIRVKRELTFGFLPVYRRLLWLVRRVGIARFDALWKRYSIFPEKIGLSLSLHCPSRCIFCPQDRGVDIEPRIMPMDTLVRILSAAKQSSYTGLFSLGENGEALTHPQFPDILKKVREFFPSNLLVLFTNMTLMDEPKARAVLSHKVDVLHFNMDGATEATYRYIKGSNSYSTTKENILRFFRLRDEMGAPCKIMIGYVTAHSFSGNFEGNRSDFRDDSTQIRAMFSPLLREGDVLRPEPNVLLQKYQHLLKRAKTEPCDAFDTVLREIVIAPNGQVYICCRDFWVSSSLGNVNTATIAQIWAGPARRKALEHLYLMRYDKTPDVCSTCLPYLGLNEDLYYMVRNHIHGRRQDTAVHFPR
jgi:radical SAM protein with 4Fe4S-binding SPASM domain